MSIAILTQVYDEARRLAVAGSVVARGDFRLKKLIPPLEQAGAKAPVFAKVATAAKAVVEGAEEQSAENLLELTALVTAVLYTQGETGVAGTPEPIETVDLGGSLVQTSARLLKPLLEALTSTGSGRLEIVRDAHERGAFRDLRLVKPALNGLDDPHTDVAAFLADNVLQTYGTAILPELRAKFDPTKGKGQPRRLRLMHRLDPAGTRELVKQALDTGTKEVKVAAIACLGAEDEDLEYLIEQAASKTADVRAAAYEALAKVDKPAAIAVLAKAITGKDVNLALNAISETTSNKLIDVIVAEIRKEWDALRPLKDKKKVTEKADRLTDLINALPNREHAAADALILELFGRRAEMSKVKGTYYSGTDVVEAVIDHMAEGSRPLQQALARAHAEIDSDHLAAAIQAARRAFTPAEFYDTFAPDVLATVGTKRAKKDPAFDRREAIFDGLDADHINFYWYPGENDDRPPLDPRWLDVGVKAESLGLIHVAARPGHAGVNAYLTKLSDAELARKKPGSDLDDLLTVMARVDHPGATDALLGIYEKFVIKVKSSGYAYWYTRIIPLLPKSVLPQLEAFVPKVKEDAADDWLSAIQELRDKKPK